MFIDQLMSDDSLLGFGGFVQSIEGQMKALQNAVSLGVEF
jgi:hypothetical protein